MTTPGSIGDNEEFISALRVGCAGMLGNVGEGSRGKDKGTPSGMLTRPLREEELESTPLPAPFRPGMGTPLVEEDTEERE